MTAYRVIGPRMIGFDLAEPASDTTALRFTVSSQRGFQLFFVFATPNGSTGTRIELTTLGDWGAYGHIWIAAAGDWCGWLADLNFDYLANKIAGSRARVPMDDQEARQRTFKLMRTLRAEHLMSAVDAKALRQALVSDFEWGSGSFLRELNERTYGLVEKYNLYEYSFDTVSPELLGFWEHAWKPFAEYLDSLASADVPAAQGEVSVA